MSERKKRDIKIIFCGGGGEEGLRLAAREEDREMKVIYL